MKTFYVIYDDFGCFNFFDSLESFRYARKHVHGLMECDTMAADSFQAESVSDCWKNEELSKWYEGMYNE